MDSFFSDLPPARDFGDIFRAELRASLPDDWEVFVTDVVGSTDAIRRGQYRTVNMMGASSIVAALNACTPVRIPFVFGGDGATLAVPSRFADGVAKSIAGVARMARDSFGLALRVGRVSAQALRSAGHPVITSRFELARGASIGMFHGSGARIAEEWVKDPHRQHLVDINTDDTPPDLSGLSCHWEPFVATSGSILSILVMPRLTPGEDALRTSDDIARRAYELVTQALDADASPNPVRLDRLRRDSLLPRTLGLGLQVAGAGLPAVRKGLTKLRYAAAGLAYNAALYLGVDIPRYERGTYLPALVERTDYRKFDGVLRMVVEASPAACDRIRASLEDLAAQGQIYFGIHRSPAAIMTCALRSVDEGEHLHFIDGSDGGYALAAVELKGQLKAATREDGVRSP